MLLSAKKILDAANAKGDPAKDTKLDPKIVKEIFDATTYYKACKVRLDFANNEKEKLYKNYVDVDNNLLISENIMEFNKKSRTQLGLLQKAWENPKDFDTQEAMSRFNEERKKFVGELNKKVEKKVEDIKK